MRELNIQEIEQELAGTPAIRVCTDRATLMATEDDKTEWIKYHPFLDIWVVFKEDRGFVPPIIVTSHAKFEEVKY